MSDWKDPDDAPVLTAEIAARAEVCEGGKVIRRASGTFSREDAVVPERYRQTTSEHKDRGLR